MAEIAVGFIGPVIEVVKWIGAPIMRQFNYLCCFTSNITALKLEAEKLDDVEGDLQGKVDRARDNVEIVAREVEAWLTQSNDTKDIKNTILDEVPNVESGCLKIGARFSLSKKAKKTTDLMIELRGQCCKFVTISQPGPPPATEAVPLGTTLEFESRKRIEEDIMTSLRGSGDVNIIGICGMGGLGKTTMAKRLMNRALEEHLFEEVVMAVVSKEVDKLKIQEDIGGSLGLKLEGETLQVRVQKLHARLSGTKRILLVLDDVWEKLELQDVGIPCGSKECTILVTSRNSDALHAMNVQITRMEILSEEEAWFLFRERSGTCVDDTKLNSIAKEVVRECKGLPIALTTLGAALKDEKNKGIWKDAVRQLKKASPANIPDFMKEVYNPLKVSYDKLDSKEAKSVFLLCCLFGEDADIPLDYLTCFCMGLGIFEGGMEEAGNSMCTLIKMLKSRSLLLDGRNEDFVRMHDVIRDVCMFIAKDEGYIGSNDCTWFSSFQTYGRTKLPTNLRLLFLSRNSEEEFEIDNTFLDGIRDLYVMFIEENYSFTSLPRTTWSLKNLNTLILSSCRELEIISGVGELVNLEILICRGCPWIKELPPEMKGLHRLKVLDLTWCHRLQRIGRGIISSLVGLEELKMLRSFKKWEASDSKERENAELRELEALTNLTCLEIQIDDPAFAAEKMHLSSKLERFVIFLVPPVFELERYSSSKKLSLNWEEGTCLGHWIEMQLLPETDCLYLSGNGANNLDLAKIQNISSLMLGKCKIMKNIVRTSMNDDGDASVFPSIDRLELFSLPDLKEIWDGPISSNSFQNLKKLLLKDLPALKQLWKSSSIRQLSTVDCLSQLEVLKIEKCEMMEQVFLCNEEEDQNKNNGRPITIVFPKLKEVTLMELPNLETFSEGIEGIKFPLLTSMSIEECPNLATFEFPLEVISSIKIRCCPRLRNLGQFSVGGEDCLSQLEVLEIEKCEMMEQVFLWNEEEDQNINNRPHITQVFPKLKVVTLKKLPNLVTFSEGIEGIEFPLLTRMQIIECPNLVTFCEGIEGIKFPQLTRMQIEECPKMTSMVSSNENNSGGTTNADIDDHHYSHLFCQPQKMSFGKLKELVTSRNPFCGHKVDLSCFNGLQELTICKYESSMSLFSFTIAQNLVTLRELDIRECDEIIQVIKDEEDKAMSAGERNRLFPNLQRLRLVDLCKLVSFCEWNCDVELPSLRFVIIRGCPNIKNFSLAPNLERFSTDLNINYLEVGVKVPLLEIRNNENPLYCYKIPVSLFSGLEELVINWYHGSMSLFSSSIVGNLVNLKKLNIYGCDEMVKVIKDDEEENAVSGDGQRTTLLFPKLQELRLFYLHKLVSFCDWKYDVELPSLRNVYIGKCLNMKYFTLGSVTTPNLKTAYINERYFGAEKDLNVVLQKQYLAREKENQENEKKGSAEDQENKAEIEEEQNS